LPIITVMNMRYRSLLFLWLPLALLVSCGVEPGAGTSVEGETQSLPAGESVPGTDGSDGGEGPTEDDDTAAEDDGTAPEDESSEPTDDGTDSSDEPEDTQDDPEVDAPIEPDSTTCDEANTLFSMCESPLPDTCDDPAPAECVLGTPSAVDGYCAFEAGASACDDGGPSRELYEWCAVEACLGGDYQDCVASHSANCVSLVCEELEAVVGYCDGYGYACQQRDPVEAACLLEVFEALESPCGLFIEDTLLCMGPVVSEWGWGSCHVQRCTGVNTFEDCYANLEILCSVVGF
jgi:hypothetical protein